MREDDGRQLSYATLEEIRIRAVKRVEAGELPEACHQRSRAPQAACSSGFALVAENSGFGPIYVSTSVSPLCGLTNVRLLCFGLLTKNWVAPDNASQDVPTEPLLAITSHPPGPVPPDLTATGSGNHAGSG